ncbi:hypothetical protein [Nocardia terpenica]|nr:hypothetical protein [Nocardia terpenica]KZM75517.1 hypothetical protein AWN90_19255 [Nocardia terpenica]NQE85998.1 hypothetical protein [Nocardia terpenica]
MLQADIDQLTKLAGTLDTIGGAIDGIEVRGKDNEVAVAMPGSTVWRACIQASENVEGAYLRVAERMRGVAGKVRECGKSLAMTDEQFAAKMHELDFHASGRQ